MKIQRFYRLEKYLKKGKVLVLYGPRRVGKTTLVTEFLQRCDHNYLFVTGDDIRVQEILGSQNLSIIKSWLENRTLLVVDEAQRIRGIGLGLKLIVDHLPGIQVLATGSSSFELYDQIGEPLTGRKTTLTLFPVAQMELRHLFHNEFELSEHLEHYLIFGSYPEVLTAEKKEEKQSILNEIVGSYLLKDILELERIKASKTILDLLRLLAFQVGNEVSWAELSTQLGIDRKTVGRYLDLLEKTFVLYNLRGFSRNLRKEITKKSKYYFYDCGIRNALIANFNPLSIRDDGGKLWENFIVMERHKKQIYTSISCNNYFWRTWDQQEIDWVEEREGKLFGYEIKWGMKKNRPPRGWQKAYPREACYEVVTRENYLNFVI